MNLTNLTNLTNQSNQSNQSNIIIIDDNNEYMDSIYALFILGPILIILMIVSCILSICDYRYKLKYHPKFRKRAIIGVV